MLHKCANPDCSRRFCLTAGKLFVLETHSPRFAQNATHPMGRRTRPHRRLEYHWLCDDCARYLTLASERGRGAILVSPQRAVANKAVSTALQPITWSGAAGGTAARALIPEGE